jgi:hypothetical protein
MGHFFVLSRLVYRLPGLLIKRIAYSLSLRLLIRTRDPHLLCAQTTLLLYK